MLKGSALFLVLLCLLSCVSSLTFSGFMKAKYGSSNIQRSMKKFSPGNSSPFLVDSYHGYVPVNSNGDDLFYWMFPSQNNPSTDPLLVWYTGGPGCSSALAIMMENGPFNVTLEGKVFINPYSWNNKANLLFVDQPIGTGFSHSSVDDMSQTEDDVATNMLTFYKTFFTQLYPEFQNRELYISGESFAGNYIPHIAHKLFAANLPYVNLKGLAIGNGWTDPARQYPEYPKYDFAPEYVPYTKLTQAQFNKYDPLLQTCYNLLTSSPHSMLVQVNLYCETLADALYTAPDGQLLYNMYDVRKPCVDDLCYDMSAITDFINSPASLNELQADKFWEACDGFVGQRLNRLDGNNNASLKLIDMLNSGKIRMLIYHGEYDYICNWMGGQEYLKYLAWNSQAQFNAVSPVDVPYGTTWTYNNLRFVKFANAGHMVPMDQPQYALDMINAFIAGGW